VNGTAQAPAASGKQALKPFAMGTTLFPVPISGLGGPLTYSANGISTLTPIPKTGFLGRLRFQVSGTIAFSTVATATYVVPLWRIIQNYTLQNSLNYPYRSWNSDDVWFAQQIETDTGFDPLIGSSLDTQPNPLTVTTVQNFSFTFVDEIWNNSGINFSRYLLSAMTTSNDLTINITWANATALQQNSAVISTLTAAIAVTAEYLTVPSPKIYQWPKRNLVQQMVGDPSFNAPKAGQNNINLTPIQGPEYLGLGIQVVDSGTPDTLLAATTKIQSINILVNGSIPLYQYTFADLVSNYERMFRRAPNYGYLYLDFMNDLSVVNAMSHTHRKVLSTAKYSQITVQVNLTTAFNGNSGSKIGLFKRTQQMYANNS
jgi:hypothetical protein